MSRSLVSPTRWSLGLVLLASLGLACGSEGPAGAVDASAIDGGTTTGGDGGVATGPTVQIGTGLDRFESLTEDQVLPLQVGPQGGGRIEGYHIFSAVRVKGYATNNLLATFRILDANRQVQAEQARQFPRLQPDGDAFVAYAVAPRVMDCCVVENQPVYLSVEVEDTNGLTGSDEMRVVAGPICEDPENQGQSLCP